MTLILDVFSYSWLLISNLDQRYGTLNWCNIHHSTHVWCLLQCLVQSFRHIPLGRASPFPIEPHVLQLSLGGELFFWRCGRSWNYHKAKGDNKVNNRLEGLVGLGVFVASTLSLWHAIVFSNVLVTPPSWELINILDDDSCLSPNSSSSAQRSLTNFIEYFSPEKDHKI